MTTAQAADFSDAETAIRKWGQSMPKPRKARYGMALEGNLHDGYVMHVVLNYDGKVVGGGMSFGSWASAANYAISEASR